MVISEMTSPSLYLFFVRPAEEKWIAITATRSEWSFCSSRVLPVWYFKGGDSQEALIHRENYVCFCYLIRDGGRIYISKILHNLFLRAQKQKSSFLSEIHSFNRMFPLCVKAEGFSSPLPSHFPPDLISDPPLDLKGCKNRTSTSHYNKFVPPTRISLPLAIFSIILIERFSH